MENEEAGSRTAIVDDNYDVFLSFRGSDTRNAFVDFLYVSLRKVGIRIFRDDEELQPGEKISEILRGVKSSQICIPIFSKNYASSKWCLRELACMVECYGHSPGKRILPIFYDVDPSDVKLETELYKSALTEHEEDPGCTEVKPWKDALTTVAGIKGWHIKDRRQGEVMNEIIKEVSQMITTRERVLPECLDGIDDRIEDIGKRLECRDTQDVRFVIIHGKGGVGKTTLATAVFNQLSPQFESRSFLSNIGESSSCCGIVKMQRKLVAELFNFSLRETFDFVEGNGVIKRRLPNKRVLLVFDGMDENDRFTQLAQHCTLCGPGSRIIITTRDKSVFPKTMVEELEKNSKIFWYEMKEMHFNHTLQPLDKLAFNTDSALHNLRGFPREVAALTEQLPLAFVGIGSQFRTTGKATLRKLKKVPLQKVHRQLKISCDALGHGAKQIF